MTPSGPHGASQPVLLRPCWAYGVCFRTARCFSARACRTVSAAISHGASQPVLGVRCKLLPCPPSASQPVLGVRRRLPDRTVLLSLCWAPPGIVFASRVSRMIFWILCARTPSGSNRRENHTAIFPGHAFLSSPGASQPVLGVRCRLPDRTVLLSLCPRQEPGFDSFDLTL